MEEERKKTETEVEVEYIQVYLQNPLIPSSPLLHFMMKTQDTLELNSEKGLALMLLLIRSDNYKYENDKMWQNDFLVLRILQQ